MPVEFLTVSEAAGHARVTRRTIYKWIEEGLEDTCLTAVVLGGVYHVELEELQNFLAFRESLYSE